MFELRIEARKENLDRVMALQMMRWRNPAAP